MHFKLDPVLYAPVVQGNYGLVINESGTFTFSSYYNLGVLDKDTTADQLLYNVSNITNGKIQVSNYSTWYDARWIDSNTFTQLQINNGQVRFVHDGSEDTNAKFSYTVTDGVNTTTIQDKYFTVKGINDTPVIGGDKLATINEGNNYTLTNSDLGSTDAENNSITYTASGLSNGSVQVLIGGNWVTQNNFTQQQVNDEQVRFLHNGSETTNASFNFTVSDGNTISGSQVMGFVVNPVDDMPVANGGLKLLAIPEGGSYTFSQVGYMQNLSITPLRTIDNDTPPQKLIYNATNINNGLIEVYNGSYWAQSNTFTQSQINNQWVQFTHNGSETDNVSFDFTITDGVNTTAVQTMNFSIVDTINDLPLVGGDQIATLQEGNIYTLATADLGATDSDNHSIAYVISSLSNGSIQVFTDNTWVTQNSFSQAEITAGKVRFVHDGSETTNAGFNFNLTDGSHYFWTNHMASGGEVYNYTDIQRMNFIITPVNDTPLATGDLVAGVNEGRLTSPSSIDNTWQDSMSIDGSYALTSGDLNITDSDNNSGQWVYTASNLINGYIKVNNGSVWTNSNTFTQEQINNGQVRFVHNGSETTNASFDFSVTDGNTITTAQTMQLSVNPFNDMPVLGGDNLANLSYGETYILNKADLNISDAENNAITYGVSVLNNGTIEVFNGSSWNTSAIFTQAQIEAGQVRFTHNGINNSASFSFSYSDGYSGSSYSYDYWFNQGVMNFNIDSNTNAMPAYTNQDYSIVPIINESNSVNLDDLDISIIDVDFENNSNLVYKVENLINGSIQVQINSNNWIESNTFTEDQRSSDDVRFVHNGSESSIASFDYKVTDGVNTTASQNITFDVVRTNDAPLVSGDKTASINEGANYILTNTDLNTTDVENNYITYTASSLSNGSVEVYNGNSWVAGNTFSQAQINAGQVRFVHNGSETSFASFKFTTSDGVASTGSQMMTFTINPVNDKPLPIGDQIISLNEGSSAYIYASDLNITDADTDAGQLIYSLSNIQNGHIEINDGVKWVESNTFTQFQVNNYLVRFMHDGSETTNSSFDFIVNDGNSDSSLQTMNFTITDKTNDIPLPTGDKIATFTEGNNYTLTSTDLNSIDADNNPNIYIANTLTNGKLEVFDGTDWINQNNFSQAQINAGQVRFIHDGSETTTASFVFTIIDGAGTSTNQIMTFNITPTNDSPLLTGDLTASIKEGVPVLVDSGLSSGYYWNDPIDINGSYILTSTDLNTTDIDNSSTQLIYTASNLTNGYLKVSNGNNWVNSNTFTQQQINSGQVRFVHNGSETQNASFDFSVTDGNNTITNQKMNFNVSPSNDIPLSIGDNYALMNKGEAYIFTNADLNMQDSDSAQFLYSVSSLTNGSLEILNNGEWHKYNISTGATFTQEQINNGQVRFVHEGTNKNGSLIFKVNDGRYNFAWIENQVMKLDVGASNTAVPVFSGNFLETVQELSNYSNNYYYNYDSINFTSTDSDSENWQLVYSASNLTNGIIQVNNGTNWVNSNTFTQADINNNAVRFVHNGSETVSAGFNFVLSDGQNTISQRTMNYTVVPINDPLIIGGDKIANINEASNYILTNTDLGATDAENNTLTYTASTLTNGTIEVFNGSSWITGTTFTQAQINASQVRFVHNGSEAISASFNFTVEDASITTDSHIMNFAVNSTNDSLVLTGDKTANLNEGNSYVLAKSDLGLTDSDNANWQLVYTANSPTNGILQVNDGINWNTQNTFTQAQIDLGLVRFVHNGSETTTANFSFTATDGTNNLSSQTMNFTINAISDMPLLGGDSFASIASGANYVLTNADLGATDIENSAITYNANTITNGNIQVFNGSSWITGTTFTQAQINAGQVRFAHNGLVNNNAWFYYTINEGSGVNTTNGGYMNFSVNAGSNIAPTLTGDNIANITEAGAYILTSADMGITDTDSGVAIYTASNSTNGTIEVYVGLQTTNGNTSQWVQSNTFTQNQINAGHVRFVQNGTENLNASFDFTVTDGVSAQSSSKTMNFALVDTTNDAPVLGGDSSASLSPSGSYTLTNTDLNATDIDSPYLTYNTSSATNGTIEVFNDSSWNTSTTFTQAQINAGNVRFVHNGLVNNNASFYYNVTDGNSTTTGGYMNFSVNAGSNTAPTLTGDNTANITKGGFVYGGNKYTYISGEYTLSSADLNIVDSDSSVAIYNTSNLINGKLEVYDGNVWNVSNTFTQAQINAGNVHFVQNGSENLKASFDFTVTDGVSSPTASKTMNFAVIDTTNDAPVLGGDSSASLSVSGSYTLTNTDLNATDIDSPYLTYNASSATNGIIEVFKNNSWNTSTTFTQAQINSGEVRFVHNGLVNNNAWFYYSTTDGNATTTGGYMNFSVNAGSNIAPTLTGDNTATLTEGANYTLSSTDLGITDTDSGVAIYTASSVANGNIQVNNGNSWTTSNTFTQNQINSSQVRFVHNGSETTSASFNFTVTDGVSAQSASKAMNFTITPVNDTPIAAGDKIANINEGSNYILTNADLNASDAENNNITYTASGLSNGTIEVFNGSSWVGAATFTQTQINDAQVRFVHNGAENTLASFNFTVGDGTNTSSAQTVSFNVNPTNDTLVFSGDKTANISENSFYSLHTSDLYITDSDSAAWQINYTISNLNNGSLEVNDGTNWNTQNTFTQQQLNANQVRFVQNGSESTNASFDFTVTDGTSTLASQTMNFIVSNVNDNPVIGGDRKAVLDEGGTYVFTNTDLNSIDSENSTATYIINNSNTSSSLYTGIENGRIEVFNGSAWLNANSFTQAQVDAGQVRFMHDGSETKFAAFGFFISDNGTTSSTNANSVGGLFNFEITPVNDAPDFVGDSSANLLKNSFYTLNSSDLYTVDEGSPSNVIYTVSNSTAGYIEIKSGNTWTSANSFTQEQINNKEVRFVNNNSTVTKADFSFTVSDGNSSTIAKQMNFNLVNSINPNLIALEDTFANLGQENNYTIKPTDLNPTDTFSSEIIQADPVKVSYSPDGNKMAVLLQAGTTHINHYVSSDGSQVSYANYKSGDYYLYVGNADGSNLKPLTNNTLDLANTLSWSPDSKQIAGISSTGDIWVIDADKGVTGLVNLTESAGIISHQSSNTLDSFISDNNQTIAFRGLDGNIYRMDADGSDLINITQNNIVTDPSDFEIEFSPDNNKMFFRDIKGQVYIADADGSDLYNLTPNITPSSSKNFVEFIWSEDNQKGAFSITTGYSTGTRYSLYTIDLAGATNNNQVETYFVGQIPRELNKESLITWHNNKILFHSRIGDPYISNSSYYGAGYYSAGNDLRIADFNGQNMVDLSGLAINYLNSSNNLGGFSYGVNLPIDSSFKLLSNYDQPYQDYIDALKNVTFSEDGNSILFTLTPTWSGYYGEPELMSMNIDGSNIKNLTENIKGFYNAETSSSNILSFTDQNQQLYIYKHGDAQVTKIADLINDNSILDYTQFSWSPDGVTGAFIDNNNDLFIFNANTKAFENITNDSIDALEYTFSPDGHNILIRTNDYISNYETIDGDGNLGSVDVSNVNIGGVYIYNTQNNQLTDLANGHGILFSGLDVNYGKSMSDSIMWLKDGNALLSVRDLQYGDGNYGYSSGHILYYLNTETNELSFIHDFNY